MKLEGEYITKGLEISDVENIFHIPRCRFYEGETYEYLPPKRGRNYPSFNFRNFRKKT